ncbi:MAG: HgcAB-associated protein HgcC [Acidobacteriota bacterium]
MTSKIGCWNVDAMVNVDERGQMVLPKEIRERAKIKANDKLALMSCEKDGEICCITLIKTDDLVLMAKSLLGPVMKDLIE